MKSLKYVLVALTLLVLSAVNLAAQIATVQRQVSLMDNPGGQGVVLDVLTQGMSVDILTVQGNWARVRIPATSEVGWVETSALSSDEGVLDDGSGMGKLQEMSGSELDRVESRFGIMSGGLKGIEQRVDSLLNKLEGERQAEMEEEQAAAGEEEEPGYSAMQPGQYAGFAMAQTGDFRWRNQFVMGTYIRGGQNYYGLSMTRALNGKGRNLLVGRAQYGLGEFRGRVDDFIDWTLGMDFNLFPDTYVIYPYFGAHFGMRHLLDKALSDRHFLIAVPSLGVRAELGSIFTLGAELRGLFRFENGQRRDDGMVGFTCGYSW